MRAISFALWLILLVTVFSCKRKSGSIEFNINKLLRDGDSSLYSFLERKMHISTRDSLCELDGNVVFDITISIDSNSIKDVRLNGAYLFDEQGRMSGGFSNLNELERILKETTFSQFSEYKDSTYGNYGIKIEFTRYFCK